MGTLVASILQTGKLRLEEMMHLAQVPHRVSWGWECELKIISQPLLTTLQAWVPLGVPMAERRGPWRASVSPPCLPVVTELCPHLRALPLGPGSGGDSGRPSRGVKRIMNLEVFANGQALSTWVMSLIFPVTWAIARYRSSYGLSCPQNSFAEVLTPRSSECDCSWRWGI